MESLVIQEGEAERKFLFLGDADGGAATGQLSIAEVFYHKKRLESGVANWRSIINLLQSEPVVGVLIKLNDGAIRRLADPDYYEVRNDLLAEISARPHLAFVHESFYYPPRRPGEPIEPIEIDGELIDLTDHFDQFEPLEPEAVEQVQRLFETHSINVVPYLRNVDINILGGEFVDQQQRNVIFRFYVPHGRIWARETEALLGLFRDYLANAVKIEVRQTSHSTATGTMYEFSGASEVTADNVAKQFETFSEVMDLCVRDPSSAEERLVELGADKRVAEEVVDRYSKQMRRIAIDVRQERERATMRIRHRLEDELSELVPSAEFIALQDVVSLIMPEGSPAAAAALGMQSPETRPLPQSLTVNIRPQIIGRVEGIVAQELSGTVHLSQGAIEMLRLIDRDGGARANDLKAAVYELEDATASKDKKLSAASRLKAFAFAAMRKGGEKLVDTGGDMLLAYFKTKLGM